MRSEIPMTTFILCSTSTTVRPAASSRISPIVASVSSGLMPAVGSSRSSKVGSDASAIASSRCRCSPWERCAASLSSFPPSSIYSRIATARSRTSVSRSARDQKLKDRAWPCTATRTFSSTLRCGNTFVIWYDFAMPSRAAAYWGIPVMSAPLNQMRPEVGAVSPAIRRKNVVLPAPLRAMVERSSPRRALNAAAAVDALMVPSMTKKLVAAIKKTTRKPIAQLINTHHHLDHTGGNRFFQGATIVASEKCREALAPGFPPVPLLQRFMPRFAAEFPKLKVVLPTVTFPDRMILHDGDREIQLWHPGFAAHTIGDAVAYLPAERSLFAGDIAFHYVTHLE